MEDGDFNEVTKQCEKLGGALRNHNQMQQFREVIDEWGFMDMGFIGPRFTWARHFQDGRSIWERLDKGLATNSFFLKFPDTHYQYGEMVEATWRFGDVGQSGGSLGTSVLKKVDKCGKELEWWDRNCFGNVRRELEKNKSLLVQAELVAQRSGNNQRVWELKAKMDTLKEREARMWRQCSRILWASKGDCNSKFFHSQATKRFRKNTIRGIKDETDQLHTDLDGIASILNKFYQELFEKSNPTHADEVLSYVLPCITDEMNQDSVADFEEWEVVAALNEMALLKAPGPDGAPPLFYQHFWKVVDKDVTQDVLLWLNTALQIRENRLYDTQIGYEQDIRQGGVVLFGGSDAEDGIYKKVDQPYHVMCYNGHLFNIGEWRTEGLNSPKQMHQTRRSIIPFPFPFMHRKATWAYKERGNGRKD
ncbi:uncharacterized protein LOC136061730 [Quercus suber]|uniref:uncharacterized protein LOC136061730 n=1 Tax=Quercus suber TaxID=58331 RepID=UPI0032DF6905